MPFAIEPSTQTHRVFLRFVYSFIHYLFACFVYLHMWKCLQKPVEDTLDLEVQVGVNFKIWILGEMSSFSSRILGIIYPASITINIKIMNLTNLIFLKLLVIVVTNDTDFTTLGRQNTLYYRILISNKWRLNIQLDYLFMVLKTVKLFGLPQWSKFPGMIGKFIVICSILEGKCPLDAYALNIWLPTRYFGKFQKLYQVYIGNGSCPWVFFCLFQFPVHY